MSEHEEQTPSEPKGKSKKDRRIKLGFLVVLAIVVLAVVMIQRKDPALKGWTNDLEAALQQAKTNNTNVIVFFTRKPMTLEDKDMVNKCMNARDALNAFAKLKYPRVHLTLRQNKQEAQRFGVTLPSTVLLLNSYGDILNKHTGFITALKFCNDVLGVQAKDPS